MVLSRAMREGHCFDALLAAAAAVAVAAAAVVAAVAARLEGRRTPVEQSIARRESVADVAILAANGGSLQRARRFVV